MVITANGFGRPIPELRIFHQADKGNSADFAAPSGRPSREMEDQEYAEKLALARAATKSPLIDTVKEMSALQHEVQIKIDPAYLNDVASDNNNKKLLSALSLLATTPDPTGTIDIISDVVFGDDEKFRKGVEDLELLEEVPEETDLMERFAFLRRNIFAENKDIINMDIVNHFEDLTNEILKAAYHEGENDIEVLSILYDDIPSLIKSMSSVVEKFNTDNKGKKRLITSDAVKKDVNALSRTLAYHVRTTFDAIAKRADAEGQKEIQSFAKSVVKSMTRDKQEQVRHSSSGTIRTGSNERKRKKNQDQRSAPASKMNPKKRAELERRKKKRRKN